MKKIITITAIAFLAITIVSCSKTSVSKLPEQTPSNPDPPKAEVSIVSKWIAPISFSEGVDRQGNSLIKGTYLFPAATRVRYDKDAHVELVYTRIPGNQRIPTYQYKKLPFRINAEADGNTGNVLVGWFLDHDGLNLYFKNAEYKFLSKAVELCLSENWDFRYLVIPKSKYQSLIIDWDDLPAVAAALGFPL